MRKNTSNFEFSCWDQVCDDINKTRLSVMAKRTAIGKIEKTPFLSFLVRLQLDIESQVVVDYKTTEHLAACRRTLTSWLGDVTLAEANKT